MVFHTASEKKPVLLIPATSPILASIVYAISRFFPSKDTLIIINISPFKIYCSIMIEIISPCFIQIYISIRKFNTLSGILIILHLLSFYINFILSLYTNKSYKLYSFITNWYISISYILISKRNTTIMAAQVSLVVPSAGTT